MGKLKFDIIEDHNKVKYLRIPSGTCYHIHTPDIVWAELEDARIHRKRIRLFYGDVKTGRDWGEENDVTGYVGRSTGRIQIPLLIHNSRSMGGGAILDHCIVKLMVGKRVVYQHKRYSPGYFLIRYYDMATYDVLKNGKHIASFKLFDKAQRYVLFMKGERLTRGGRCRTL